jgi:hypothetical protein
VGGGICAEQHGAGNILHRDQSVCLHIPVPGFNHTNSGKENQYSYVGKAVFYDIEPVKKTVLYQQITNPMQAVYAEE